MNKCSENKKKLINITNKEISELTQQEFRDLTGASPTASSLLFSGKNKKSHGYMLYNNYEEGVDIEFIMKQFISEVGYNTFISNKEAMKLLKSLYIEYNFKGLNQIRVFNKYFNVKKLYKGRELGIIIKE